MFKIQPLTNFLSKGCSLWILPTPETSYISKEVDWHLSCIYKKLKHKQPQSLLIESSLHLPNKLTLFLPFDKSLPLDWIKQAYIHWRNLKKPSLKLLIPTLITSHMLSQNWNFTVLPYSIQLIFEKSQKD